MLVVQEAPWTTSENVVINGRIIAVQTSVHFTQIVLAIDALINIRARS